MKKTFFVILFCLITIFYVTGEEKTVLSEINVYGGKTIQYVFSPQDKYGDDIRFSYYLYNQKNELMEVIYEFTDTKANDFGYKSQSEKYKNKIVTEYKLELTDEAKKIQGILWKIERVDSNDTIYEYEYFDGVNIAKSNAQSFVENYPFYTLPYLEEVLFEDYEENKKGNMHTFSAKYTKSRTFIEFSSDPVLVNERDREIIDLYFRKSGQQQYTDLYSHKVSIKYLNKEYTCYLQNNFVEYIKKNDKCLLTYVFMGLNKDLILLAVEFSENE